MRGRVWLWWLIVEWGLLNFGQAVREGDSVRKIWAGAHMRVRVGRCVSGHWTSAPRQHMHTALMLEPTAYLPAGGSVLPPRPPPRCCATHG